MAAAAAVPAASVDQSGLLQSFDATAAAVTSTSNGATTAVVPTAVAAAVRRNGGSQVNQPGLLLSTTFWRERVESSSEGVFVERLLRLVCSLCRPFRSSILILLSHSPRKRCNNRPSCFCSDVPSDTIERMEQCDMQSKWLPAKSKSTLAHTTAKIKNGMLCQNLLLLLFPGAFVRDDSLDLGGRQGGRQGGRRLLTKLRLQE